MYKKNCIISSAHIFLLCFYFVGGTRAAFFVSETNSFAYTRAQNLFSGGTSTV